MAIVLNEAAEPREFESELLEAAMLLVEAANACDDSFSIDDLTDLLEAAACVAGEEGGQEMLEEGFADVKTALVNRLKDAKAKIAEKYKSVKDKVKAKWEERKANRARMKMGKQYKKSDIQEPTSKDAAEKFLRKAMGAPKDHPVHHGKDGESSIEYKGRKRTFTRFERPQGGFHGHPA
jgi:hypothetical protein